MVAEPGKRFCYDSPGMHLLSAILQETTGMTALDFARQHLFGPLGIQDVIWETDPQGYSRGWGDLHLLPEDLAKIGFLWLHRGSWDGQQIVPEAWVLDSVKPRSMFVKPYPGYGNGWWIAWEAYLASGRGGQIARVMASKNTIVVITGANFAYSQIETWLTPMLLMLKDTLPANPAGASALQTTLSAVEQGAAIWTANYTPGTAAEISGNTYICNNNPAGIETIRLEFDGSAQASLFLKMGGMDMVLPIGLDGSYRLSSDGTGARGYWEDAQTFHFEAFDIGLLSRKVVFDGDKLEVSLPEAELTVACQVENP